MGYLRTDLRNLRVDGSAVQRTVAPFNTTQSVQKHTYPKERASKKFSPKAQLFIMDLVLKKLGIYLHDIVSLSTLGIFLHKGGFTHQKLRTVALQQDRMLREQFSSEVSVYNTEMFVFVDETGSDGICAKQG